jgi:Holliday junction resolvasome RuvABC DNA-binding subunit
MGRELQMSLSKINADAMRDVMAEIKVETEARDMVNRAVQMLLQMGYAENMVHVIVRNQAEEAAGSWLDMYEAALERNELTEEQGDSSE